ncbi:tol-pal system YbgF family protein [Fibrobacterota bacterium]
MINLFLFAMLLTAARSTGASSPDLSREQQIWYKAGELADRLKSEQWKFRVVKAEIKRLQEAARELNNIQLYPASLTRISEGEGTKIDRVVRRIIKRSGKALDQLEELKKPLQDAIVITMEMMKESPNLDMMEILTGDNIARIQDLIKIKKHVDRYWDDISEVMLMHEKMLGIEQEEGADTLFDESFFKVLISQIGQASDLFYARLHDYKDSLVARASQNSWNQMAGIDLKIVTERTELADLKAAQRDLSRLSQRFRDKIPIGAVNYYLGQSYFLDKEFGKAINAYELVGDNSSFKGKSRLGILQSLFAKEDDDSLLVLYESFMKEGALPDSLLQPARYMAIQSYFNVRKDTEVERAILTFQKKNDFYYRSLLIYAKSLVRQKRDREASDLFKSVIKQTQLPEAFKLQARLLLALLKYEQEYYESALSDFNQLIDKEGFQPDALFGMVWCYVKTKNVRMAEVILKKLINQFPNSPLAIEGMLLLSKWRFIKAVKLWEYKRSTSENMGKLARYQKQLKEKSKTKEMSEDAIDEVSRKLSLIEMNLSSRIKVSTDDINRLFGEALILVNYIGEHYKTGEFSNITYSSDRERTLAKLKHLLAGTALTYAEPPIDEGTLSLKIYQSQMLYFDMMAYYRNWLREYLEFMQAGPAPEAGTGPLREGRGRGLHSEVNEKIVEYDNKCLDLVNALILSPHSSSHRSKLLFYKGLLLHKTEEDKISMRLNQKRMLDSLLAGVNAGLEGAPITYQNTAFERVWAFLLSEYHDSDYLPHTLYYLGYAQAEQNDHRGIALLESFLEKFPEHEYRDHIHAVIGDHYFGVKEYGHAVKTYNKILEEPSSEFFDKAIYKVAWSHYKSGAFGKALKAFSYILEGELKKGGKGDYSPLLQEAIKMVSFCFAKLDTLEEFQNKAVGRLIESFEDKNLGGKVLHQMALVYRQQGRLVKAKKILETLKKEYPEYGDMPEAMMDLAVIYDIENEFMKAVETREQVFAEYNRTSPWYAAVEHDRYRLRADSLCESALNKIAFYYFSEAKLKKRDGTGNAADSIYNKEAFMRAIGAYKKFLDVYPDSKNAGKLYYQLAESYFAVHDYYMASVVYLKASRAKDETLRNAAAYNAVIAAQKHLEVSNDDR